MPNLTKAPRPCYLPGKWFGTCLADTHSFDSNFFKEICIVSEKTNEGFILYKLTLFAEVVFDSEFMRYEDVLKLQLQVIHAIASAQHPWLKADGYQFVEGQRYEVLHIHGGKLMHDIGEFGNYNGVYGIDSSNFAEVGYIKAFKPLDDSPEAWEALAHVEVC